MMHEFRRRFWLPPRAHGEVIEDRTVSFLELFYDLVYVVVIARAAHALAEHVSWKTVAEFAVVFGLIWIAWLNGTLYYELHGREDGRTRTFVFIQMLLLALLAVFTADATGAGGKAFALVYAIFLGVLTIFWYTIRRQDSDEYNAITARYLTSMVASTIAIAVSAFLPDGTRILVWGAFVVSWILLTVLTAKSSATALEMGISATDSMVERFGLFTIIVLGEVVVGVVDGLSNSDRSVIAVSTGMFGLMIGFAFWWTYFDFVGRRLPVNRALPLTLWMLGHLPFAMSIAAIGAAMVSLVEHASDDRSPAATAWLLSGSVALGLLSLVLIMRTLLDYVRLPILYQPVTTSVYVAAIGALLIGWARPAPLVMVLLLIGVLATVWWVAVNRWLSLEDPDTARPQGVL